MAKTTISSSFVDSTFKSNQPSSRAKAAQQAEEKRIQKLVDYEYAYRTKKEKKFRTDNDAEELKFQKKRADLEKRLKKEVAQEEAKEHQRILYETAGTFKKLTIDSLNAAGITTSKT